MNVIAKIVAEGDLERADLNTASVAQGLWACTCFASCQSGADIKGRNSAEPRAASGAVHHPRSHGMGHESVSRLDIYTGRCALGGTPAGPSRHWGVLVVPHCEQDFGPTAYPAPACLPYAEGARTCRQHVGSCERVYISADTLPR